MGETYGKKELKIAREIGIDDVLSYINQEKIDSISEEQAVALVEELLKKKEKIFGYANNFITQSSLQ